MARLHRVSTPYALAVRRITDMAYLSDDGTLDTVIVCDECGTEHRFNYSGLDVEDVVMADGTITVDYTYDEFVADCIADVDAKCDHNGTEVE
jgi:hypothetical protein